MRVASYVRVSTQRQAQAQTIEQQLGRLQTHCQQQGWQWKEELIFRDDGYSGSTLKRPGLDRLRDKAAQAAFEKILITAPDRLARNYVHQVLLIEELEKKGCQLEFLDRPMSSDPHDQLLLQIRGAVAEYERTLIAERMRRGRLQKYKAGNMLPWTLAPYGYRLNPDRPRDPSGVSIEASEAVIVNEIFIYYIQQGHSLGGLARYLMEKGILTPKGNKRWNPASLRNILTNPIYSGVVYANRHRCKQAQVRRSPLQPVGPGWSSNVKPVEEWIEVARVPPIVSQEQFELVRSKLSQNQSFASRNNIKHQYLLRALISCGVCQLACSGRSSSQPAPGGYSYYWCRGRSPTIRSCRDEHCIGRYIPQVQLDELVWQDLCQVVQQPSIIEEALSRLQGGEGLPQELTARRENLRKGITSLANQLERLTEAYLGGVLSLEEYKRRRQDNEEHHSGLQAQLREVEANAQHQLELSGLLGSIEDFCKRVKEGLDKASFEQKRELVELLIDRVVVTNGEVEIRYVIPTSRESENRRFCLLRTDYFGWIKKSL
jgi:site-specific DNA recombinase